MSIGQYIILTVVIRMLYAIVFGIPGVLVSGLFWCLLTVGIVGMSGWNFVRKM